MLHANRPVQLKKITSKPLKLNLQLTSQQYSAHTNQRGMNHSKSPKSDAVSKLSKKQHSKNQQLAINSLHISPF
jgi:hypothetical protein